MVKAVFFDIDGTLSAPCYMTEGKLVVGFTDEGWFNHCNTLRENCYDYCKVVNPIKRYAISKKASGARLYVLSVSQSEGERLGKIKFINDNYPGLFDDIIQVEHNSDKVIVMSEYAENNSMNHSEIEIVEDTYSIVLNANDNGFVATHVASIVCDL